MLTKRNWKLAPLLMTLVFVFALGGITLPVGSLFSQDQRSSLTLTQGAGLTAGQIMEQKWWIAVHYHVVCYRPIYDEQGRKVGEYVAWTEDFHNRTTTVGLNQYLAATLGGAAGANNQIWYIGLVGATATDGAINNAANNFVSASGAFSASDVGQPILLKGISGGSDLSTTVLTYVSATNVTIGVNASGANYTTVGYLVGARLADTMGSHSPWVEVGNYSANSGSVNGNRATWVPGTASSGAINNPTAANYYMNAAVNVYGSFMCNVSAINGSTGVLLGMGPFATSRACQSGDILSVTASFSIS